jgi:hypothetical protein
MNRARPSTRQPPHPPENPKENQDISAPAAECGAPLDTEQNAKILGKYPGSREKPGISVRDVFAGTGRPRINATHHHADRGLDAYWTPPEAVSALLRIENVPRSVAGPACGSGAILDVLRAAGHTVHGSDIVDYGWPGTVVRDYLADAAIPLRDAAVVTNPPYRLAQEFVLKALESGAQFAAFLLRLNFLESMRRKEFFETHPPSRVWVSSRRLPMMVLHLQRPISRT